jgi:hypothetical protein
MIMATLIQAVMSGLIAASAIAVIGASASAALTPKSLAPSQVQQIQTVKAPQQLHQVLPVQKAVWSKEDQQKFWEQEEDRGG